MFKNLVQFQPSLPMKEMTYVPHPIFCSRVRFSQGPKDTSSQDGRFGVHVESEVVLKCEGNSNEGACDMLCWM